MERQQQNNLKARQHWPIVFKLPYLLYSALVTCLIFSTPLWADDTFIDATETETSPVNDMLQAELKSDQIYHDDKSDCYKPPAAEEKDSNQLDTIQASLQTGICQTTRWIDQLFGQQYKFNEDEVSGRIALGVEYDEFDGTSYRGRLVIHAPLKNLNNKFNLFIGRVDENAFITDTQPDLPGAFHDGVFGDDNSWLLGLGYRQRGNRNSGFSYSAGINLPLDPYAKARYHYNKVFNDKQFLRFRQTLFWRADRGLGTTSRINLFQYTNSRDLWRWDNTFTVAQQEIEGLKWFSGITLYHRLHDNHAVSSQIFVKGQSSAEVPVKDYGLRVVWRRPIARKWFFIEAGPSITWPRRKLTQHRDLTLGFSVLVEMQFGDYKY